MNLSYMKRCLAFYPRLLHRAAWLYIVLGMFALTTSLGATPLTIKSFPDLPACNAEIPDELKGKVTLCPVPTITSITCLGVNEDTCRQSEGITLIAGRRAVVSGKVIDFLENPIPKAEVAIYATDSNFFGRGIMRLIGFGEVIDGKYTADIVLPNLRSTYIVAAVEETETYAASNSASQTSRIHLAGPQEVTVGTMVSYLAQVLLTEDDFSPGTYRLLFTIDRTDNTQAAFLTTVQEVQLNEARRSFLTHRFDEPGTYKVRVEFDGEEYYQPNISELEVTARYPAEIVLAEPVILGSTNYELRGRVKINGLSPQDFPELRSYPLEVNIMALHAKTFTEVIVSPGPHGEFEWNLSNIQEGRTILQASLIETSLVNAAENTTYAILPRTVFISLDSSSQGDLLSNHPHEFSGFVTDTDRTGISGVDLTIVFSDAPEGVHKVTTDHMGAFKVMHTPEGEGVRRIHIEANSASIRPTAMQWDFRVVTPYILESETPRGEEVAQGNSLQLNGSLVVAGTPLAGEVLQLLVNDSGKVGETTTDDEGRFSFSVKPSELGLEDGIYKAVYFVPAFNESIDTFPFRVYSGVSIWVIVGSVMGGLVMFTLFALLVYYFVRQYPGSGTLPVRKNVPVFGKWLRSPIKPSLVIRSTRDKVKRSPLRLSITLKSAHSAHVGGYSMPVCDLEEEIEVKAKVEGVSAEDTLPDSVVFHLVVHGKFRSKAQRRSEVPLLNGFAHIVIRPDRVGHFEIHAACKGDAMPEVISASIDVMVVRYRDEISSFYNRFRRLYLRPRGPVPRSASPRETEQLLVVNGLVEDQTSLSLLVALVQQADFSSQPVKRSDYIQAFEALERLSVNPDEEPSIPSSVITGVSPSAE